MVVNAGQVIKTQKRVAATEMCFLRRLLRISWKVKKSNEEALREANVEREVIRTVRKRQMQFLGRLNGHKGL